MKNVINYFYGMILTEYKKRDTSFIFYIQNIEYEFVQYYGDINNLINIYSILVTNGKLVSEIVANKNNNLITFYENKPYILLKKINKDIKDIKDINIYDVISYDFIVSKKEKNNWKKLWIEKLDYYNIQLEEMSLKYPLLKQSFCYYLGMSEIAINLLNCVNYENVSNCIAHKRLRNLEDIFNPLNIIIDNKARDVAEYIKTKYFTSYITEEEIIEIINSILITNDEMILLMSRLIYPSYYFDIYEKIYLGKELDNELKKIIKKNAEYEAFLKKIYSIVKLSYNIPQIEFLEY